MHEVARSLKTSNWKLRRSVCTYPIQYCFLFQYFYNYNYDKYDFHTTFYIINFINTIRFSSYIGTGSSNITFLQSTIVTHFFNISSSFQTAFTLSLTPHQSTFLQDKKQIQPFHQTFFYFAKKNLLFHSFKCRIFFLYSIVSSTWLASVEPELHYLTSTWSHFWKIVCYTLSILASN